MKSRIRVFTAALAPLAQLQSLAACLVDGIAEESLHAHDIEASLLLVEVEHLAEIALREAGYLFGLIRPLGVPFQTFGIDLVEATKVLQAFLQTALFALQQVRVNKRL